LPTSGLVIDTTYRETPYTFGIIEIQVIHLITVNRLAERLTPKINVTVKTISRNP
jgi:hypothetical protein